MKKALKFSTLAVAAVTATLIGTGVAQADPTSSPRPINAVGSDTTQDVWNGLSNLDTNVASWNAFLGTSTTINLDASTTINRPAGSGAGVQALSAAVDPAWTGGYPGPSGNVNVQGKISFARSSSAAAKNGTDLTYLPFARDAVSLAVKTTAGPVSLTTAQLQGIYNCTVTTITAGTSTVTVHPKLPQANSGTRAFFLSALGITTPGTCVTTVGAENDGAQLTTAGDVIPFSAAQWIAQRNNRITNTTAGLELATLNGQAPTTGTAPSLAPGALYGSTTTEPTSGVGTFARDTYNVVKTSEYTGSTTLATTTLKTNLATTNAKNAITAFGFQNLSYVGNPTIGAGLAAHQSAYKH